MEFIAHRVNTIEELRKVPKEYGVELDLRDFGERLILQHDPFIDGCLLYTSPSPRDRTRSRMPSSA